MGTISGMGFAQAQVHTVHSTSAEGQTLDTVPLSTTLSGSMKERRMNHSYVAGTRQRYPDRSDKAFLMTSFFCPKVVLSHLGIFDKNLLNYWFCFAQGNLSIKLIDSKVALRVL